MRYDPLEINDMLKRAVLLVDTREQDTPAYRQRLQQIGSALDLHRIIADHQVVLALSRQRRQQDVGGAGRIGRGGLEIIEGGFLREIAAQSFHAPHLPRTVG